MIISAGNKVINVHSENINISNNVVQIGRDVSVNVGSVVGFINTSKVDNVDNAELKIALHRLVGAVREMVSRLPPDKAQEAAESLDGLATEATRNPPRKKWCELFSASLIEAGELGGALGLPVVEATRGVMSLLMRHQDATQAQNG